jgi:hypothetical protein
MNILFYSLLIFGFSYLILKLIANFSSKKLSRSVRFFIFVFSIILAALFAFGGRFLLSLPLIFLSLAVVKLKGLTIYQIFALYRLIQTLRMSGRFSFNQKTHSSNYSSLSLDEAYKILNLDKSKKITKEHVQKAYTKIQKKIHPDVSPETSRLSAIVNEAKDVVLKNLT